jgi:dihydropteroate synthase
VRCGRFELALGRPLVMGVVNLTPDSFFDGGRLRSARAAVDHARRLLDEGADLIDLGAESTRPGAAAVPDDEELRRLLPVLGALADVGVPLSVDTRKPAVMRAAIAQGADLINDVAGFRDPEAVAAVAASPTVGCCVMHMQGDPSTMQGDPVYRDVVSEVRSWLAQRVDALQHAGVDAARIVVDPGIGFGKTVGHNLRLLARLGELAGDGRPVLVGVSRKSVIGAVTGRSAADRLPGSLSAVLAAVARGARIVRVHDVAATRDALAVWRAIEAA